MLTGVRIENYLTPARLILSSPVTIMILCCSFDGKKLMVESGEEAETVTAIDVAITVKEGDRRKVSWYPTFRLIDTADVAPDPQVKAEVDRYVGLLSDELDVAIGKTETELDSQRASVRGGETAIGNLIVDAMREAVGADIAITNGGGIRGNYDFILLVLNLPAVQFSPSYLLVIRIYCWK